MTTRYRIIKYQNGTCKVQYKGWFFWHTAMDADQRHLFDREFQISTEAEKWIEKRIAANTIKRIYEHP
jgi:hypothetical protein